MHVLTLNRSALGVVLMLAVACGDDGGSSAEPDAAVEPEIDASENMPDAMPTPDARQVPDAAPLPDVMLGLSCNAPVVLAVGQSFAADTEAFNAAFTASCSPGSQLNGDVVHSIDVGTDPVDLLVDVTVDEGAMPPFDAVVYGRSTCNDANTEINCSDSGFGDRVELLAVTGEVFVIVDGTHQFGGDPEGAYTLNTASRAIVAETGSCDPAGVTSRCEAGTRCQAGTCVADSAALACSSATTATPPDDVTDTTFSFGADFFQGSCAFDPDGGFAEHVYSITLNGTGTIDASTDFPETSFDTVLYLRSTDCESGTEIACHDDVDASAQNLSSHLVAPDLAAGTYFLYVDGSSDAPGFGSYRLTISIQ